MAQNHIEENNYPKAIAISTALMGAFIALSFFWIIGKFEPNEELGMGGMVVNYGTSVEGMGTDYTSIEEPSMAPDANNKKPDQITPDPTTKSTQSQLSDKNLTTQDSEDAVSVNTKETKSNANPSSTKDNKAEQPSVNPNALYKGKKNNASGGGDGPDSTPGNKGDIDGDPLAPFYGEGGSGNGNKQLELKHFSNLVKPEDDSQEQGRIIMRITVNRQGKILNATTARGSTLTTPALVEKCRRALLNASLVASDKRPDVITLYVPFVFTLK